MSRYHACSSSNDEETRESDKQSTHTRSSLGNHVHHHHHRDGSGNTRPRRPLGCRTSQACWMPGSPFSSTARWSGMYRQWTQERAPRSLCCSQSRRPSRRSLVRRLRTLDSERPSLRAIDRMDSLAAQAITTAASSVQSVPLKTGNVRRDTPGRYRFRSA